jgi:hypothetical protein
MVGASPKARKKNPHKYLIEKKDGLQVSDAWKVRAPKQQSALFLKEK